MLRTPHVLLLCEQNLSNSAHSENLHIASSLSTNPPSQSIAKNSSPSLTATLSNSASLTFFLRLSSEFFIILFSFGLIEESAFAALFPACLNMSEISSPPDDTVRSKELLGCGASCNEIISPEGAIPISFLASSITTSRSPCIFSVSFLKKSSNDILFSSKSSSKRRH